LRHCVGLARWPGSMAMRRSVAATKRVASSASTREMLMSEVSGCDMVGDAECRAIEYGCVQKLWHGIARIINKCHIRGQPEFHALLVEAGAKVGCGSSSMYVSRSWTNQRAIT
jgi:hypothetical protein